MNGIHDMGGMDGFGPVFREENEPVFHSDWERRTWGLALTILRKIGVSADELRHAIERIPPARYLASSYYERWLAAVETILLERGVVTREEFRAALGDEGAGAIAKPAEGPPASSGARSKAPKARFKPGDPVRARNINPPGHTRLPRYARGKAGVVVRDWGVFVFPDTNAHRAGTRQQHCYAVAFDAHELWGKPARAKERVNIDLWEDYLELAGTTRPKKKRGKR
jgi:nitrile hydratase subunit beta